jgi:hypothetical protein
MYKNDKEPCLQDNCIYGLTGKCDFKVYEPSKEFPETCPHGVSNE